MSQAGKIIVIVAPSGTGKSTLIKRLKRRFPKLEESVSHTTRPKRPNEEDGVNYFYINEDEFLRLKQSNSFLEWAMVHSHYYGTSQEFVENKLKEGINLLFDLDVQGANFFKERFGELARIIFIEPPSLDELEARLIKRATDSKEVIAERIGNAKKELEEKDRFDYNVVNKDIEKAYSDLEAIFSQIIEGA